MKSFVKAAALAILLATTSTAAFAEASVRVGGAPMYASKNIIENAVNSKDHTTLVAAVKAAGLVEALSGKGPFTVFAPVNAAFAALPAGTVDTLLKPENKAKLVKILTAHVIAGNYSAEDLAAKAKTGPFALKTLSGDSLSFQLVGTVLYVIDENGGASRLTIKDVNQSNGVIHVVEKVLLPK